jgi:translocation and assembly module TamB
VSAITGRLIHWLWAGSALLLLATLWLLSSTAGSQLLLRMVAEQSEGLLDIGTVRSGHLLRRLELDRLQVNTPDAEISIDNLVLDWSPLALLALRAQINLLQAEAIRVQLRAADPDAPKDETAAGRPPERLPINIVLRALAVERLTLEGNEGLPSPITDVALGMSWIGSRIRVTTLAATLPEYGDVALQADASLSAEAILLRSLQVSAPFAIDADATYAYDGAFAAALRWQEARWPLIGEPDVESAQGELRIEGRPEAYQLSLDAGVKTAQAAADLRLRGTGSTEHLQIEELLAQALDGSARVTGGLRWTPDLSADLEADIDRLNPAAFLPDWPGAISGRLSARGRAAAGEPIRFSIDIADSQLRDQRFSLRAEGRWQDETLHLAEAELRQGVSRLSARGRAWPQLDLEATVDSRDLGTLLPELAGSLSLSARLSGDPQLPSVTAEAQGENLGWDDQLQIGRLELRAGFDPRGPLSLTLDARALSGGAELEAFQLSADGRIDAHRIALSAQASQGRVEIGLVGGADVDAQRWLGRLETASLSAPNLPTVRLQSPAALRLSAERSALDEACWRSEDGERVDLCLQGEHQPSGSRLSADIRALDYALADPWMPPDFSLQGGLSGRIEAALASGQTPLLDVQLRTRPGALALRDRPALELKAGVIALSENREGLLVNIDLPMDEGGGLRLQARAPAGADWQARPLDARFEARFDNLDWINRLSPELQDLEGQLEADVSAQGTLGAPALQGAVELKLPQLFLVGAGVTLVDTVARLTATPDGQGRVEARTRAGNGTLNVEGELFLDTAAPTATLRVRGDNAQLVDTPDARIWLDPDLTIVYAGSRLDVSGRIEVPRADITPRGGEGGGQGPTADQIVVRDGEVDGGGDAALEIHADVTLALGSDVRFKGFGLSSRFSGQLRALQQPGQPATGRGEIRLVDGRFKAYGQDLSIETGRLLFSGGPLTDPAVEIRATRTPREDITVGVSVRGRLDRPEFSLFSTPAMPQDEQLGWLVLGRPITTTGEGGDQAALANAALSLGLSGSDFLAQRVKGGLRIDDISIGARPGEDPEQARLTLGKYLTPSLYVSYGVGLFQPGHVFRLLYDIGRGFKLQTETGVASGADLLYTIER